MALPLPGESRTPLLGGRSGRADPDEIRWHKRHMKGHVEASRRAAGATLLKPGRDDMLSAVEPGIDRPLSGPDQRQRHAQHRQCGGNTRMGRRREGDPRLGARRHNSGDRRPQTPNEQEAGQRSDHLRCRNRAAACRGHAVQRGGADQQPLNQKPGARPAIREVGEKPLHLYPNFSLRESQRH